MHSTSSSHANPSGRQGVCPNGWHLPSESEWEQLTSFVSGQHEFYCNGNNQAIAKSLASSYLWNNSTTVCTIGNDKSSNNSTGFSALPAGYGYGSNTSFGDAASFWSSTVLSSGGMRTCNLYYSSSTVDKTYNYYGFCSVRCVRDIELPIGQACPGTHTVTDYDGNVYNTVQIGNQCWMKENMRATHYSDGTGITGMYAPNNDISNANTYGYLYGWTAVTRGTISNGNPSGVQGVCPVGWHVPSAAEWTQLTDYVSQKDFFYCSHNYSNYIAKSLASNVLWESSTNNCAVGNDLTQNNATGFSALPAGSANGNLGTDAIFWSTTEYYNENNNSYNYADYFEIYYSGANVSTYHAFKANEYSVRCIRDIAFIDDDHPHSVQNISQLRSKMDFSDVSVNQIDTTEYHLTGSVVVTGKTSMNNYKIIQDETAAIYIYDPDSLLGELEVGNQMRGLYGSLINYYGLLEFRPTRTYVQLENVSQTITPLTVTLSQLDDQTFMNQHQSELVQLNNVTITSSGNFTRRNSYILSQNNTALPALYVLWPDHDYLNMTIPTGVSMNIKGFVYGTSIAYGSSYGEYRYYIVPRSSDDMQPVGGGN